MLCLAEGRVREGRIMQVCPGVHMRMRIRVPQPPALLAAAAFDPDR